MHRWQNKNKVSKLAQSRKQCEGVLVEDQMERSKHWSKSISEFWLPEFWILGDRDVTDSRHQESRSAEMRNPETRKRHITRSVGYGDFGYREMEMSEIHIIRSPKVPKCEIPKPEKRHITRSVGYWDFGYREMEMLETHIIRSPEVPKCENLK
jgi:hypothetical protein